MEEDIFQALEKHLGVSFLVAEDSGRLPAGLAAQPLTPGLLRPIAEAWRVKFRKAIVEADYSLLQQLLHELRPLHPEAAAALGSLVGGYEYERVLVALDATE